MKAEKEFISKLEEILLAEELVLPSTPGFGDYKPFLDHAVAHPAKANTKLLEFLILNFTNEGDVILDPMAGSGSTGVVAALHNRNAIQVEIEPKFYEWMQMAREKVERAITLLPKGWIKNILGDARRLSELLSQADVIITSPPYSDSAIQDYGTSNKALLEFEKQVRESFRKFGYFEYNGRRYTEEEWRRINKGELKPRGMPELWAEIIRRRKGMRYNDDNPENIGNLPFGNVDIIITSPPYSSQWGVAEKNKPKASFEREKRYLERHPELRGKRPSLLPGAYSTSEDNIGNLPFGRIDAVITSPPYEECMSHRRHHTPNTGRVERLWSEKHLGAYPPGSEANIGNLASSDEEYGMLERGLMTKDGKPTYLSEMLKVYREMWKVLKPGGRAIIIVKPFIRNKRVIDLPYYTYLLMRLCGFELEKLYKLRLERQSFWRILFYRKHPEVPRIAHEYVLVCRKSSD
jgi:DNA modification methylase